MMPRHDLHSKQNVEHTRTSTCRNKCCQSFQSYSTITAVAALPPVGLMKFTKELRWYCDLTHRHNAGEVETLSGFNAFIKTIIQTHTILLSLDSGRA